MMILAMAFPNIIGLLILSREVKLDLKLYLSKLKDGSNLENYEMIIYKKVLEIISMNL